jgi:RNA polymerase sigma-70 factor (ECF subfamily)
MTPRSSERTAPGDPFDLAATIADDVAFRTWYDAVAPRVYAYVYARTGSVAVAEDVTQETFIEVVRRPASFDGRSDPVPWLIGVARHRLSRHFRALRRQDERTAELVREIHVVEPIAATARLDDREDLAAGLRALTTDQRAALVLRFVDGLSVRQVAATIGRTEDATESLIRRAREAFERVVRGDERAS